MLEEVGIVLNERENQKAEVAQKLELQLKERSITSFRFEIAQNIIDTLYQERPAILILDYIIGDYTTGLDILEKLNSLKPYEQPLVYFLTDEPSAQVATQAMRLGAKHFLQVDNPRSLSILTDEIEQRLNKTSFSCKSRSPGHPDLDHIVAESKEMIAAVKQLKSLQKQRGTLPVFLGPKGSGKKVLAKAYHQSTSNTPGYLHTIRVPFFTDDFEGILSTTPYGDSSALLFTECECDDGELLEYLTQNRSTFTHEDAPLLLFTTSEKETALAWNSLLESPIITIPALAETRKADLLALVQKFTRDAAELYKMKCSPPSKEVIEWLSTCAFPHNVAQLREILLHTYAQAPQPDNFLKELQEHYQRSLHYIEDRQETTNYTGKFLRDMLEIHRYRYRVVAAKCGLSIQQLHKALSEEHA